MQCIQNDYQEEQSIRLAAGGVFVDWLVQHVTRHTSHVTRHTSHVTRHTSHVTRHTSHVTRHTSHVPPHTTRLKCSHQARTPPLHHLRTYCMSHVIHHTSHITHHTSHVTRHTSHVTRYTFTSGAHAPLSLLRTHWLQQLQARLLSHIITVT